MQKIKYIILIPAFLIFGCRNYVDNIQINNLTNISKQYCNESGFKNCTRYYLCMVDSYDKVKSKYAGHVGIAISYISYDGENYSHLMDKTYNLLNVDSDYTNHLALSISYFIYAHNSCASIIADKTYNIDRYMPLLREKLGVK